jgi:leader peptidase (prepilin peptidase)/N-methyltransferase
LPIESAAYLPVVAGLFGLLIGSFLNVCIYRIPRDLSVVAPRSFCPECGGPIAWYDNIPLWSYFALRGRARCCGQPIGIRYPIVEFTTALAFIAVVLRYGATAAALKWIVFESILMVLFWTDLEERILPDELTLGGTVLGLMLAWFIPVPSLLGELFFPNLQTGWRSLIAAGLGGILLTAPMWLLAFIYERVRNREGLGLGDVKLLALLGVFLGLEHAMAALLVGAVSGAIIGLIYISLRGKTASTYELPFGSFLCAGAALISLLDYTGQGFGGK